MKKNANLESAFNRFFSIPRHMSGHALVISAEVNTRKMALAKFEQVSEKLIKLENVHHSRVRFYRSYDKRIGLSFNRWHLYDYAPKSCAVWYCLEGTLPYRSPIMRLIAWFTPLKSKRTVYAR